MSGLYGRVHRLGGPKIREEIAGRFDTLAPGEITITSGYDLHCKHIIHAVVLRSDDAVASLQDCVRKALLAARGRRFHTIAFPLLAAGETGMNPGLAANIICEQIRKFLDESTYCNEHAMVVVSRMLIQVLPQVLSTASFSVALSCVPSLHTPVNRLKLRYSAHSPQCLQLEPLRTSLVTVLAQVPELARARARAQAQAQALVLTRVPTRVPTLVLKLASALRPLRRRQLRTQAPWKRVQILPR